MNKTIIAIIIIGLLVVGFFVFREKKEPVSPATENRQEEIVAEDTMKTPETPGEVTTYTPPQASFAMAEVAIHNNKNDCWSAINGSVYNLTAWISSHPGGQQAIVGLCGKDGSAAFNGQHGGRAQQEAQLAKFKIGALAN